MSLVEVEGLRIELAASGMDVVDDVSFTLEPGDILGLVGESGSGKTTVGMALLRELRRGARLVAGRIAIDGVDILAIPRSELHAVRARLVSYVPQDPASALNPALRIRTQLREVLDAHQYGADDAARAERVREVLGEVKLPSDDAFLRKYPHQLSGGQQQRIAIAMAFACRPKLIVLDEPATGLDVTTQAHVLETVRALAEEHRVAALYVTHDLAVISDLANRVMVMYGGRAMEIGSRDEVFLAGAHPYTRRLVAVTPDVKVARELEALPGAAPAPGTRPSGCVFNPRCHWATSECTLSEPPVIAVSPGHTSRCLFAEREPAREAVRPAYVQRAASDAKTILEVRDLEACYRERRVLHGISLDVFEQECLALVGESGSGKTTMARCISGLVKPTGGRIGYRGEELPADNRRRSLEVRRDIQYIFQNPYMSLNPRKTVRQILAAPVKRLFGVRGSDLDARVSAALEHVALPSTLGACHPRDLSGGECQRVAIARALVCQPRVLICDEITSALDVSVQAAIVLLLQRLQREEQLSIVFVTHNLALVRSIADRTLVLNHGEIVESGPTSDLIDHPRHEYTQTLLANTPTVNLDARSAGERLTPR